MHPCIVGIHAIDGDLRFLKRMVRLLGSELGSAFEYLKLDNKRLSHINCLKSIKSARPQDTILFLCHGRSTGILGCNFMTQISTHRRRYEHGELISLDNFAVLKDRKVFCMTCDSNRIATEVISQGARVFVGFDSIYFDRKDLMETDKWNKYVVDITKHRLRKCVLSAILYAWENDLTYFQCAYHLKLLINKTNDNLILGYKHHRGKRFYHRAADSLQLIKEGIRVWGDGNLRLTD